MKSEIYDDLGTPIAVTFETGEMAHNPDKGRYELTPGSTVVLEVFLKLTASAR